MLQNYTEFTSATATMEILPERTAYKSAGRVADLIYVEYIVALPQGQRRILKKKKKLHLEDFWITSAASWRKILLPQTL